MNIDFHNHVGKDPDGGSQSVSEILECMKISEIDHAVIFPFSGEDLIQTSLDLLEDAKEHSTLSVFLRCNPIGMDETGFKSALDKGFKGVKLHPNAQKFDILDESYHWIFPIVQSYDIPVLFHTKASQPHSHPQSVLKLAKKFPQVNFVIAHFFGDCFQTMKDVLDYPNVYVDISVFGRTLRIKQMVESGYDRMLLASDSPYDDMRVSLLKVKLADIADEERTKMLSKNAIKLLRLN